jgi:hypothetical protein
VQNLETDIPNGERHVSLFSMCPWSLAVRSAWANEARRKMRWVPPRDCSEAAYINARYIIPSSIYRSNAMNCGDLRDKGSKDSELHGGGD